VEKGRYRLAAYRRLLHLLFIPMKTKTDAIDQRNRRVETYRRLVRPIAHHYAHRTPEPLEDLEQVGLLGLLRAAELYNAKSSTPFDAFARPHIRGAILHYLRDRVQPIRLPRRVSEQLDLRRRCVSSIRNQGGLLVTDETIRRAMGLSEQGWEQLELARRLNSMVSLDAPDLAVELREATSACQEESGSDQALQALGGLEAPLQAVVRSIVISGWSYRQTARQLNVSPMTVKRRLALGLERLRREMGVNRPAGRRLCPSAAPGC
jgi:RNA polymerase sigma-B factor